jgi:hypothetical protein
MPVRRPVRRQEEEAPSKIVSAVGVSHSRQSGQERGAYLEKAMSDAVMKALADGISLDKADEVRKRMLAARDVAAQEFDARQEAKSADSGAHG